MTIANAYHAEIISLRAQLEEAQEELRQLREALMPEIMFPPEWGLTLSEREILLVLHQVQAPVNDSKLRLLCGRIGPDSRVIDVFICRARKKLLRFGIEIETVRGKGYRLLGVSRDIVTAAIEAERACWKTIANNAVTALRRVGGARG